MVMVEGSISAREMEYSSYSRAQRRDLARHVRLTNISICIVLNQCIQFTFGNF